MNPFVSQSELDIRAAGVARARELYPSARIIHELNVEHGTVRADVAAVTVDQLILFEIKSERDRLHRLATQLRHFSTVAHHVVVVAHERWCQGSKYPNCDIHPIMRHSGVHELWQYPEQAPKPWGRAWQRPSLNQIRPWPHLMLRLLWTDELRAIAADSSLVRAERRTGRDLAKTLAASLPGAQVEQVVCRTLRSRQFTEADAPLEAAS